MEETERQEKKIRARPAIEHFLEKLRKEKNNRGVMADLRQGINPATAYRAWPHVVPSAGKAFEFGTSRQIWLTVAAGFAMHKCPAAVTDEKAKKRVGNLGKTLRGLALGSGQKPSELKTFDGRFRRFLACQSALEVCDHLPGVIRAAERKGIPIDFEQLFVDLTYWDKWGEQVKVRWARDFWGNDPQPEDS